MCGPRLEKKVAKLRSFLGFLMLYVSEQRTEMKILSKLFFATISKLPTSCFPTFQLTTDFNQCEISGLRHLPVYDRQFAREYNLIG
ncbi:hypothetical protein SUGI_0152160 [Cryptomeria japonica]|nr:hypothetical protein SUGI_0152160 [Cryptomeria japonica]